jgi:hypothetical protein
LKHRADPGAQRILRAAEGNRSTVDPNFPRVRRIEAAQQFDERALSRAVLATTPPNDLDNPFPSIATIR